MSVFETFFEWFADTLDLNFIISDLKNVYLSDEEYHEIAHGDAQCTCQAANYSSGDTPLGKVVM